MKALYASNYRAQCANNVKLYFQRRWQKKKMMKSGTREQQSEHQWWILSIGRAKQIIWGLNVAVIAKIILWLLNINNCVKHYRFILTIV